MAEKCMSHVIMILGWTHTQDVVSTCCILANWVSWMLEIRAILVGFMGQPRRSQKKWCVKSRRNLLHFTINIHVLCLFVFHWSGISLVQTWTVFWLIPRWFFVSYGSEVRVQEHAVACPRSKIVSDTIKWQKALLSFLNLIILTVLTTCDEKWLLLLHVPDPQFLCECWAELHFQ